MATGKTYELFYLGTGPGQAKEIRRAGFSFLRGVSTPVPKEVFEELKDEVGFSASAPKEKSSSKTTED